MGHDGDRGMEVSGVMPDQAEAVFDAADPRSWDYYGKDVFESTQVGSWRPDLQEFSHGKTRSFQKHT